MRPVRTAVKAIVVQDGRLLATQNVGETGVFYILPGGGQENGETLIAALERECREEVGVEVEVGRLLFIRDYIGRNHEFGAREGDFHQLELMFECRIVSTHAPAPGTVPDARQTGVEWLSLDEIESAPFWPKTLRPHLRRLGEANAPVYLGDVN